MVSVINVANDKAQPLVEDERLPVVSFTGSGPVGYAIQRSVPASTSCSSSVATRRWWSAADWDSEQDLDWAATRIATFSNYQAGQSCIGVQRVLVHEGLHDVLVPRLVDAVKALPTGDPADDATQVGPVINADAADRIRPGWARPSTPAPRVLTGGTRDGDDDRPDRARPTSRPTRRRSPRSCSGR